MPDFTPRQLTPPQSVAGSSVSFTFSALPTPGNMIVVICGGHGTGVTFDTTDNQTGNGAYTIQSRRTQFAGWTCILSKENIAVTAGTFVVTVDGGAGADKMWGIAIEVPWFGGTPLVVFSDNVGGLSGTASTGNTAPTTEHDYFVASCITTVNLESFTVEAGFTQAYDYGSFLGEGDYKAVSGGSLAAQSCSWALTNGSNWIASIAVFQSTAAVSGERVTQVARSVIVQQPSSTLRVTQVAQGIVSQTSPVLRVTQVVQTVVAAVPPPSGAGQIMTLDTADLDDVGVPYLAFVKTRAVPPSGSIDKLGSVRDAMLVAGAESGVTLQVEVDKNLGFDFQASNVSLTADLAESRVMKKCEGITVADARVVQFKIGDAVAIANTWDLDHFRVPQIDEDE